MKKSFKLWMLAAMMTCGLASVTMTSCTTGIDNPVVNPDVPDVDVKDYVERIVPVVDPQNKPQGVVTLRFYDDMPSVAYVSIIGSESMPVNTSTICWPIRLSIATVRRRPSSVIRCCPRASHWMMSWRSSDVTGIMHASLRQG